MSANCTCGNCKIASITRRDIEWLLLRLNRCTVDPSCSDESAAVAFRDTLDMLMSDRPEPTNELAMIQTQTRTLAGNVEALVQQVARLTEGGTP